MYLWNGKVADICADVLLSEMGLMENYSFQEIGQHYRLYGGNREFRLGHHSNNLNETVLYALPD